MHLLQYSFQILSTSAKPAGFWYGQAFTDDSSSLRCILWSILACFEAEPVNLPQCLYYAILVMMTH